MSSLSRTPFLPPGADTLVHAASSVAIRELHLHLRELARRTHAQVNGAEGVGATLRVGGEYVFAGSNSFAEAVDHVQYGLGEGPCLSAVESQQIVRSRTIGAGELRWERFIAQADELGLRSVASVPVQADSEVVGSLNLYGLDAATFDSIDAAALLGHAEVAGRAMMSAWLVGVATATAETLAEAARDREDIDIAVGFLMDRYAMTAAHARILIGQLATQDQVTRGDAARSLTDGPQLPTPEPTQA